MEIKPEDWKKTRFALRIELDIVAKLNKVIEIRKIKVNVGLLSLFLFFLLPTNFKNAGE